MQNAMRNLSGIHAESTHAFSMLDSQQQADFTLMSHRFHANFTQNSLQNAMRNLSGIHAESTHALSTLDSMTKADFTHILG